MPIDQVVDEGVRLQIQQYNAKVCGNREVVKRMLDATAYLSMQELSFRGHDEGENYRELLEVIAQYDRVLAEHMESSTVFTGMSITIQNDLIAAIHSSIKTEIKKELNRTAGL